MAKMLSVIVALYATASAAAGKSYPPHDDVGQATTTDSPPARHEFWGISTGSEDKSLPANLWHADNFIMAAPVGIQKQPTCHDPHPPPTNLSRIMNRTVSILALAPPGKKTLTFDGGAPCGNHHPLDNIFVGKYDACKNAKGLPTNFSGLWWDHGIDQIAIDWAASLAEIKARGATWNFVTIDTECDMDAYTVTSWQRQYNPSLTQACSDQYFDAIQDDPRLHRAIDGGPSIYSELLRHGFDPGDTTAPHWLRDALPWNASEGFNANLAAWQAVTRALISGYKTKAYLEPALAVNPEAGLADYDEWNWATESCSLQMNGFHANGCGHASCADCTVGNTAAPSMYGWMHNVSDGVNFPGFGGPGGALTTQYGISEFAISPFNAFLWSVYHFRAVRLASPDVPVKPWVAYRSYPGDGGPTGEQGDPIVGWVDSDYYQEIMLHMALMGADDFLLFNPCFDTCCWFNGAVLPCDAPNARPMATLADNQMYSKVFAEATAAVGYEQRAWVPEATPGGWLCDHVLTAMETPRARVWRFTARDGDPARVLAQTGPNVTLTLAQGDFARVVFADAKLVRKVNPSVAPVSAVGLWINQSLAAPLPEGWKCQLS